MTVAAGDLQVAFGEESTWGTAVAPTKVIECTDESVKLTVDRIESKGLAAGRVLASKTNWGAGKIDVNGDISFEVGSRGFGLLFKHMLGCATPTPTTVATSARRWNFALSATDTMDNKSLTTEIARTDVAGQQVKFTYPGTKIENWELSCQAGEFLMGKISINAKNETSAVAAGTTLTYPTGSPLTFVGAVINVAGSAVPVKQFDIKGDNALKTDRYYLAGTSTKAVPVQNGLRSITGSLSVDWSGQTAYDRFVNGTTASLSAKFETAADIATSTKGYVLITCTDVRFDGTTPTGGGSIVDQNLDFVVLDDETSGTAAFSIEYQTLDTAIV
jgi:hypothetical protein